MAKRSASTLPELRRAIYDYGTRAQEARILDRNCFCRHSGLPLDGKPFATRGTIDECSNRPHPRVQSHSEHDTRDAPMNLSGPHHRLAARGQGTEGGAFVSGFRPRPAIVNATQLPKGTTLGVEARPHRRGKPRAEERAWHASVCDEVCETRDGALSRRIKILITDGPQFERVEIACS